MNVSLYTPWSEPAEALEARTVGREEELAAVAHGAEQLASGGRPLPLYFFGPRGVGKSHLLAVARARLAASGVLAGWHLHTLSEDVPRCERAAQLQARLLPGPTRAWSMVRDSAAPPSPPPRTVVFVEGLDRHLDAMSEGERRILRAWLHDRPELWLVASGARLSGALTGANAAFYGAFATFSLRGCTGAEAGTLIDRVAGVEAGNAPGWPRRREAIHTLAGGYPRALIALSRGLANSGAGELPDQLLRVLDDASAHYRVRFEDLTTGEQLLVELLVRWPRKLGPTDAAAQLGGASATWSTHAHRLADAGVLDVEHVGRNSFFSLKEPLFRYWIEFRTAPWAEARIAWVSGLLEAALAPEAPVHAWHEAHLPESGQPPAVLQTPGARAELALLGLAYRSPERFAQVAEALGPAWADIVRRADSLAAQLHEGKRGPLHPELAVLRAAVAPLPKQ